MITGICSPTNPTPLKCTDITCHMIASFNFFNPRSTFGTISDIVFGSCPIVKFRSCISITRHTIAMPFISASKTYSSFAFRTLYLLAVKILCSHPTITSDLRAVSDQWIFFKFLFFKEILILSIDLVVSFKYTLKLII